MKLGMTVFVACCLVSLSCFAEETTPPDMRGTWVGMTNSAVYGTGQHHPGGKHGEFRFRSIAMTFSIEKQQGRNFAGTHSSAAYSEPVVGAFTSDLRSGVMADLDGSYIFKLTEKDRMEVCYTGNSGGKNPAKVASCYELKKQDAKP